MRPASTPECALLDFQRQVAPGTALREGLERILRGRTGALIVLGQNKLVESISTGGFPLDVPFTPTALRELAKMDGAIVLDDRQDKILRAGVHLMPDAAIETVETGTRHRTADRVARQTGLPVVSVSASMSTIALYVHDHRHLVEDSAHILSRANQALQTLERYRERLWQVANRLSSLEVEDQVTVKDLSLVAQRLEMVRRLEQELGGYVAELGTDGRLLTLQLQELAVGMTELRDLLEIDYTPLDGARLELGGLARLSTDELLDLLVVARGVGFVHNEHLDTRLSPRGFRQLAQINRLPPSYSTRLLSHFGSLQSLFAATTAELQEVDGVGESRARVIREGLTRLAESVYAERMD